MVRFPAGRPSAEAAGCCNFRSCASSDVINEDRCGSRHARQSLGMSDFSEDTTVSCLRMRKRVLIISDLFIIPNPEIDTKWK